MSGGSTTTARSSASIAWVRDAAWLGARRAVAYSKIIVLAFAIIAGAWIYAGDGLVDPHGKPIGSDFVSFWAASSLTLAGAPASVYDLERHKAAEAEAIGHADIPYYAFFYPPVFLLIAAPLALIPYGWSLAIWLAATGAAYAATARRLLGVREWLWPTLGFPAALVNVMHGQNAFLTTALCGGGMLLLDRRPVLAGALLGVMAYKPQLGCLVPLALLVSGRWTALAAAAATAILPRGGVSRAVRQRDLCGVLCDDRPRAPYAGGRAGRLEQDAEPLRRYAPPRLLRSASPMRRRPCWPLAAAGAVVVAWRGRAGTAAKGAVLAAAALLFSPFLLDYDLVLLAIPLAFLSVGGRTARFPAVGEGISRPGLGGCR